MQTFIWQYRVLNSGSWKNPGARDLEKSLNELGAEGWELISMVNQPKAGSYKDNVTQYIFKRPMYTAVPPAPWGQQG